MSARQHSFELKDFLAHIMEALRRIEGYTAGLSYDDFRGDTRCQDAVIRNFEVIGEACRNIEKYFPDFVAAHPELPIRSAYEMRNALSHGYFGIDLAILWQTVSRDLPDLKQKLVLATSG
jgi:uncharacterized protein with HEPN domain